LGVSLDYLFYDAINIKKNIYIDSMIVKMSYMSEEQQSHLLKIADTFSPDRKEGSDK